MDTWAATKKISVWKTQQSSEVGETVRMICNLAVADLRYVQLNNSNSLVLRAATVEGAINKKIQAFISRLKKDVILRMLEDLKEDNPLKKKKAYLASLLYVS